MVVEFDDGGVKLLKSSLPEVDHFHLMNATDSNSLKHFVTIYAHYAVSEDLPSKFDPKTQVYFCAFDKEWCLRMSGVAVHGCLFLLC